jgi:hypothetical protein
MELNTPHSKSSLKNKVTKGNECDVTEKSVFAGQVAPEGTMACAEILLGEPGG